MEAIFRWVPVVALAITAAFLALPLLLVDPWMWGFERGVVVLIGRVGVVLAVVALAGVAVLDAVRPPPADGALVIEQRDFRGVSLFITPIMLGLGGSALSGVPTMVFDAEWRQLGSTLALGGAFATVGALAAFARRRVRIDPKTRTLEVAWMGPRVAIWRRRWSFDDFPAMFVDEVPGRRGTTIHRLLVGSEERSPVLLYESPSHSAVRTMSRRVEEASGWPAP